MKKIIPTLFATVLAISSVSLLIGCTEAVPDDPTAKEEGEKNKHEGTGEIDPDTGIPPEPKEGELKDPALKDPAANPPGDK